MLLILPLPKVQETPVGMLPVPMAQLVTALRIESDWYRTWRTNALSILTQLHENVEKDLHPFVLGGSLIGLGHWPRAPTRSPAKSLSNLKSSVEVMPNYGVNRMQRCGSLSDLYY
jgi:hypothetical protein